MGDMFFYLPNKSIAIGRDDKCDIALSCSFISRIHLVITPHGDALTAELYCNGTNDTYVNDVIIPKGNRIYIGISDYIRIGDLIICWHRKTLLLHINNICDVKSRLSELYTINYNENGIVSGLSNHSEDRNKGICFTPTVRISKPYDLTPIEIEGPPARRLPEKPSLLLAAGPALTMALPILLGAGRKVSIITSVFAAVWAVLNVTGHRRKGKNEERRRRLSYTTYIHEKEIELRERYDKCYQALFEEYPVVADYLKDGGNPFILWNRCLSNEDKLKIRLGIGDIKFPIDIRIPREKFAQLDDSLKDLPNKLSDEYKLLERIPIALELEKQMVVGFVGNVASNGCFDRATQDILNAFLLQIMLVAPPSMINIIVDGASYIDERELNYLSYLPNYIDSDEKENFLVANNQDIEKENNINGLLIVVTSSLDKAFTYLAEHKAIVILLTRNIRELPSNIDRIIMASSEYSGIINPKSTENIRERVVFDSLDRVSTREYIKCLARLAGGINNSRGDIPSDVDFGKLLMKNDFDNTRIIDNWNRCDVNNSIGFPIGIGTDNKIIRLDISEKKSGPHGLIAGSTGSGKSELLTTIILSAACCYPPDRLGFFLIDYKGGSMSNLFAKLPHLLGSISNLSKYESKRAMISLYSENVRRQEIFNKCNVSNITEYTKGYDDGRFNEALPHILIIIDEFAELKKEEPDFMQQLISIAAVGRSLGVHLIMATQKPAGVIDEKIRSNSRFRIALRVEDASDSMDMLKSKDAAYIRECGRAYLQVGNNDIYEQFQCGYAFSSYGLNKVEELRIYDEYGRRLAIRDETVSNETNVSWYEHLMTEIEEAMSQYGRRNAFISPLWLEALRNDIKLDELKGDCIALADAPRKHTYLEVMANIKSSGHLCILGKSGSGKSNLISAILIKNLEISDIYIIDYGGGSLEQFKDSNCCGGYIDSECSSRIKMLLRYIDEVLSYRGKLNTEQHRPIILVIDNVGEAIKGNEEIAFKVLMKLLKHGKRLGMYLILSANNVGMEEIPSRLFELIDRKIILGDYDIYQVATYLKIKATNVLQCEDIPGRGITIIENEPYIIQTGQVDATITDVINAVNSRKTQKLSEYPYLPDNLSLEYFLVRALKEKSNGVLPLGYEEDTGKLFVINLNRTRCLLVSGKKGSGKRSLCEHAGIVATRYGFSVCKVNDAKVLLDQLYKTDLIIIDDLIKVLSVFYNNPYTTEDEETLANALKNDRRRANTATIIAIANDGLRSELRATKILDSLMANPYAICLGGMLDENRLFDFSYLSYSSQAKKKSAGRGTVLKANGMGFYGDVVIPTLITQEE